MHIVVALLETGPACQFLQDWHALLPYVVQDLTGDTDLFPH